MKLLVPLTLVLGIAVGLLGGWLFIAPDLQAPATPPSVNILGRLAPAPPPIAVTPAVAEGVSPADSEAAEDREKPENSAGKQAGEEQDEPGNSDDDDGDDEDGDGPLVPTTAGRRAVFDNDITLIPRGPGRFAVLDLRSVHRKKLSIHAGELERSGGGSFSQFSGRRVVGTLRGPRARVELLNLGFDRDGVPTIAHIRPANRPSVEGIVSLRRGDRVMRVLPDRGRTDEDEPF